MAFITTVNILRPLLHEGGIQEGKGVIDPLYRNAAAATRKQRATVLSICRKLPAKIAVCFYDVVFHVNIPTKPPAIDVTDGAVAYTRSSTAGR